MENRAHAIAAGLFALLLAAALAAAGLWFRRDDIRFTQYTVTTTSSVSGLKAEAAVRYRGVDVGRVESIKIEPGLMMPQDGAYLLQIAQPAMDEATYLDRLQLWARRLRSPRAGITHLPPRTADAPR